MEVGLILWTSKKQPCVALSTTESEYIAEVLAVQEAIWLSQLLSEIEGSVKFMKIPTAEMAADGLTTPLGRVMFKRWISQIGLSVYNMG
ncbi:Probable transposable element [Penicillium roqueforti FM164]|uniref:Probable transposable element n=1 Tax=Penicillium roqueforti (strain FM164) TaxID=1365484 RepID=W6QW04_PENRF|nr:Probable transposable element [Penicillium roqueforti FM164]